MKILEFVKCPKSGQLVAHGEKGIYWIDEQAFTYVKALRVDEKGPRIEHIGTFTTLKDAVKYVYEYEEGAL